MDYINRLSDEQKRNNLIRKVMRILVKIVVVLLIVYLFVSAFYIWQFVDFGEPTVGTELLGQGYANSENRWRVFMGLPPITTTYRGVPPAYLLSVAARLIAAVALLVWLVIEIVRWWKEREEAQRWTGRSMV